MTWIHRWIVEGSQPAYLRYPILVDPDQKSDLSWLDYLNAEIGVWFTGQIHPTNTVIDDCPNALIAAKQLINLPINYASMK